MAAVSSTEKPLTPHPVLHAFSPPPGQSSQVCTTGPQQSCDWHLQDSLGMLRCALNHICLVTFKRMGQSGLGWEQFGLG